MGGAPFVVRNESDYGPRRGPNLTASSAPPTWSADSSCAQIRSKVLHRMHLDFSPSSPGFVWAGTPYQHLMTRRACLFGGVQVVQGGDGVKRIRLHSISWARPEVAFRMVASAYCGSATEG